MEELHEKKKRLETSLLGMGRVLVAFSAGVDSALLLKTAHDLLGERAVAVTVRSPVFPERETDEARAFCEKEGIEQIFADLPIDGFRHNPKERCYLCKREMFSGFRRIAAERGILHIAEGSNKDDEGDYRPGLRAASELGIRSPLREAGLTKPEIRRLAGEAGLSVWKKPSFACLATRFAYGEEISDPMLSAVERAEQKLRDLGFGQVRVRVHGKTARIEIDRVEHEKILCPGTGDTICSFLHELGFGYVTLDLDGYRTGSMNGGLEING